MRRKRRRGQKVRSAARGGADEAIALLEIRPEARAYSGNPQADSNIEVSS